MNVQSNHNHLITSEAELRKYFDRPIERAIKKQKSELDIPSKEFIKESPFLCLATISPNASADCSPKGDAPGFVKIVNDKQIIIPDRKGNNRLDSLVNILHEPKVGIIFFVPGKNETLRLNGRAHLSKDPTLLQQFTVNKKCPKIVILVDIDEVYLHCPKALVRSSLWEMGGQNRRDLTTYIRASREQLGISLTNEEVEKLAKEYRDAFIDTLY